MKTISIHRSEKDWRWTMLSSNKKIIGASTEGYKRRHTMLLNLMSVTDVLVILGSSKGSRSNGEQFYIKWPESK